MDTNRSCKRLRFEDLSMENRRRVFKPMKDFSEDKLFEVMKLTGEVLDLEHLGFWLSAGTVLGLYRDDGFIPHDTDIDFEVLAFSGYDYETLISLFEGEGFLLQRKVLHDGEVMQLAFTKDFVLIDLYFYYSWTNDCFINCNDSGVFRLPKKFFDGVTRINGFRVPCPVDDYLVYRYGSEWRKPAGSKGDWAAECPALGGYDE
jgi:hypothetical protein